MTWMDLLGKSPIPTSTPTKSTDRLVALHCALSVIADSVVSGGASDSGRATTPSERFEDWLSGARGDEQDAHLRRMILIMVCEKAPASTRVDQILAFAKALHRHTTRR